MLSKGDLVQCVDGGSGNIVKERYYRVIAVKMDGNIRVNDGTDDYYPIWKFKRIQRRCNGSSN